MEGELRPLPAREAGAVLTDVVLPLVARGLIIRRPRTVDLLARYDADRRAVRRLRKLRERHGVGSVVVRVLGRRLAVVISSEDACTVLDQPASALVPATREKRAALGRFEPAGVLVSDADSRSPRRRLNEAALETHVPVHSLGAGITAAVQREADDLVTAALGTGCLVWPAFEQGFMRLVRRVVVGNAGAEDEGLTAELAALRREANWGYLRPGARARELRFRQHLAEYVRSPPQGSLVEHLMRSGATGADSAPLDQVPQWLFAFDAAGIATFAALAMLCVHPEQMDLARHEIAGSAGGTGVAELPFLRACLLECLRLWPTTPAILRDVSAPTRVSSGMLSPGTSVLVFTPLFHRDERLRPQADAFAPGRWLRDGSGAVPVEDPDPLVPLVPFSRGETRCPGRELVLLVTSQLLASLLGALDPALSGPTARRLRAGAPLPGTLDHFRLEFRVAPTYMQGKEET